MLCLILDYFLEFDDDIMLKYIFSQL